LKFCYETLRSGTPADVARDLTGLREAARAARRHLTGEALPPPGRRGKPWRFWGTTYTDVFEAAAGAGEYVLAVARECTRRPATDDAPALSPEVVVAEYDRFRRNLRRCGRQRLAMGDPSPLLAEIRRAVLRWARGDRQAVRLGGRWKDPAVVRGKSKNFRSYVEFKVIKALVEAGREGLDKDRLEGVAPSARRVIRTLCQDPDWSTVIQRPGTKGNRYRIIQ
jgi:hypothetical protein